MDGFKHNPKMRSDLPCFKEGGYVSKLPKMKAQPAAEEKMAEKKAKSPSAAVVKEKEMPAEFAKKKAGRAKKEAGTVKRFKTGGVVDADGKGEKSGDVDKIKKVKDTSKKANAPSKAKTKSEEVPGYAFGGMIPEITDQIANAVRTAVPQSVGTQPTNVQTTSMPNVGGKYMSQAVAAPQMDNTSFDVDQAPMPTAMQAGAAPSVTAAMSPFMQKAKRGMQRMPPPQSFQRSPFFGSSSMQNRPGLQGFNFDLARIIGPLMQQIKQRIR